MSGCIVIAVLNGIEISHKLFMPEMVGPALAIHGCESVLGMPIPSAVVDYWIACSWWPVVVRYCDNY